jgi:hypothetical protein
MDYVVMRKDLSSVLANGERWMVFENISAATKTAENFSGVVKPFTEAIAIIKKKQEQNKITSRFTLTGKTRAFFNKLKLLAGFSGK